MAKSIMSGKLGIIIPVVLGLLAVVLSWQYLRQQERKLGFMAEPLPVLVATRDIPKLTRLDETMLKVAKVPRKFAQPGHLPSMKEALDQVTTAPILEGEQILGTKLVSYGMETGLAIKVPRGFRAVTVAATEVSGVAQLIKPGNFVDVLATFEFGDGVKSEKRTFTMLQDVLVLAVGQSLGQESEALAAAQAGQEGIQRNFAAGNPDSGFTVTVALKPPDCQAIVLAQEAGALSMSLRSMFEGHQVQGLPPLSLNMLLGINEKVLYKPRPTWREIRGTAVGR